MASKPLHVRRLQRTLSEFSVNRAQFLIATVPFIGEFNQFIFKLNFNYFLFKKIFLYKKIIISGLPPIDFPSTSSTDNLTAALQFLVPGDLKI